MTTKKYHAMESFVAESLLELGFQVDKNRTGKDRNICFVMSHKRGIDCEIPYSLLESYPLNEQKVDAVLGFYIDYCCRKGK